MGEPQTIGVIVGRDLVGDALMKLPFLRALRQAFPRAEIHWITALGPTAFASSLRESTRHLIDVVHEMPAWIVEDTETAPSFDVLIDTRNRWKLVRRAKKMPHGLFLAMATRHLFSNRRPSLFQKKPVHLVDRLLQTVELASGQKPIPTGGLPVKIELVAQARELLPEGEIYVGLATGAGNPVKIWPRYKFEKLAAAQVAKGRVPVFILGPQELAAYDALAAAVPEAKFPLQERGLWGASPLTLDHTLAIGSLMQVAVANDSGVGHMLAAVDCPLISLFGPTSAEKLAPRVTHGRILKAQDYGSSEMKVIPWEAVDGVVDDVLKELIRCKG